MWTDGRGFFYEGDCRVGDRAATEDEITAWQLSVKPNPQQQIDTLESDSMMNRAVREFFLQVSEGLAAQQGVSPSALYSANVAYRKVKDLDNQIKDFRTQIA